MLNAIIITLLPIRAFCDLHHREKRLSIAFAAGQEENLPPSNSWIEEEESEAPKSIFSLLPLVSPVFTAIFFALPRVRGLEVAHSLCKPPASARLDLCPSMTATDRTEMDPFGRWAKGGLVIVAVEGRSRSHSLG